MDDQLIRLEMTGGCAVLRFTRPERRNPYGMAFITELLDHLEALGADDAVRAVVMTGGRHFSAGGDLPDFSKIVAKGARATQEMMDRVGQAARACWTFPKPLIAAVEGVCFGAGMSLALSADVIVAGEDARFCQIFSRIGGCPDAGSSWLLQHRIGGGAARLLVLTGREVKGPEAQQMGLVELCVPADAVEATALALAKEIAAGPLFGVIGAKRVMREVANCSFEEALMIEGKSQSVLLSTDDMRESMAAFTEKRKAVYHDR